jgi:hypothetical protein
MRKVTEYKCPYCGTWNTWARFCFICDSVLEIGICNDAGRPLLERREVLNYE